MVAELGRSLLLLMKSIYDCEVLYVQYIFMLRYLAFEVLDFGGSH